MRLRIAIVVHGRFYAFDLARALIEDGHEVTLYTNYPKSVVEKFGVPRQYVRSFVLHGVVSRIIHLLHSKFHLPSCEAFLHPWFSRWAACKVRQSRFDAVQCFSGVAEELYRCPELAETLKILVRGSAHILEQARLLEEEEQRSARPVDKPSAWMVAREEREYALADRIMVLSSFSRESFLARGFALEKFWLMPLTADVRRFRPDENALEERYRRILSGMPLNVLTVGTFSFQKGMVDLIEVAKRLQGKMHFRFVGAMGDAGNLSAMARTVIDMIPHQEEQHLKNWYAQADIFIFPTIQDGYAAVIAQAFAAGLPVLATTNCGAPDLIQHGNTGWILPVRDPEAFVETLLWCESHREELAAMLRRILQVSIQRDWSDVAREFAVLVRDEMQERAA